MPPAQRPAILILVENLPVPFDRRVWMEATTLHEAGYAVSVICPQGDYSKRFEILEGIRVYRYPLPSMSGTAGHLLEYGIALPCTLLLTLVVWLRHGFQVLQSANPPDLFFLIALLFKPFGKKFVFDHHDAMPEICRSRWRGWKMRLLERFCLAAERASFGTADRVIANNESYRRLALQRGGVDAARITVVRNAPSLQRFVPQAPRLELKGEAPYLVAYLGVIGPNDGLPYLLHAIAHLVHRCARRDIRFVVIGSGDLFDSTVALSRNLQIADFVHFTGRIPDAEMQQWLATADVCVAPDPRDPLNDISSMNKIVEYMAMAKPMVCFDLPESRLTAAGASLFVPNNDARGFGEAIAELLADPERRRAMGEAGRRRFVDVLAWEHQAPALLRLYAELLGA